MESEDPTACISLSSFRGRDSYADVAFLTFRYALISFEPKA
jgi:hypothetical protein